MVQGFDVERRKNILSRMKSKNVRWKVIASCRPTDYRRNVLQNKYLLYFWFIHLTIYPVNHITSVHGTLLNFV
jgi:hypothetical protein